MLMLTERMFGHHSIYPTINPEHDSLSKLQKFHLWKEFQACFGDRREKHIKTHSKHVLTAVEILGAETGARLIFAFNKS